MNPLNHPISNEGASDMHSERIFQREDGRWYFRIRGNTSMGPYSQPSRSQRQHESLRRFVPAPVRNELHVAALVARQVTSRAASTNTAPAHHDAARQA